MNKVQKRIHERITPEDFSAEIVVDDQSNPASVVDIGMGGAAIDLNSSSTPLEKGHLVELRLEFNSESLQFQSIVVESDSTLRLKFLHLSEKSNLLQSYIDTEVQLSNLEYKNIKNKQKHILIVDDSKTIRRLLKKILTTLNYIVILAQNGKEASEILEENFQIDLVITDWDMPIMDGASFLRRTRGSQKPFSHIPFIFSTVIDQNDPEVEKLWELGISGYLMKPFSIKSIKQQLQIVFGDS